MEQWNINDFNGNSQIFFSEYRDGNWTHPSDLSDSISLDGQNANLPNVAIDNNGNAIITWEQYDDSGVRQIFKSEFRNGNWKHPINFDDYINPSGGFFSTQPQVSMDNSNSAIIVWNQNVTGIQSLFKSEYRNGKWTHPSGLEDNFSPCGDHTNYPQVAMDNNGNAIISWNQSYGSRKNIYKSEFRNGSWDHPNIDDYISPEGTKAYLSPQISMNKSGNAIIVWVQYDSNDIKQIFFSEYRATPAQTPAANMKSMPWIQLLLDD